MRVLLAVALLLLPAVAAHDEGVPFDPAADLFPDPQEVQDAIQALDGKPGVEIVQIAESQAGRPITMVIVTNPESDVPMAERVVTFIMTQQHGNEPAGTPAAIALISQLESQTGVWHYLDNQILILLPQSNPDGAIANRRTAEDSTDINRDHVALVTPEAQALHSILNEFDVHMAMDHHEYGGIGVGYPSPVHIYDYDLTTMYPNHGNVRQPVRDMVERLNYDFLYPHVRAEGYSISDYGWTTIGIADQDPIKLQQSAGGPDPGILRNNYGLNNVVGLLVESFVHPAENPLASFDRRVGSHLVVMEGVLQFGSENAAELIATKRASEALNLNEPLGRYLEGAVDVAMPEAYQVTPENGPDIDNLLSRHGLPPMIMVDDQPIVYADHFRSGLVAAMLQPESSRSVASASAADDAPEHPARDYLPDYGTAERGQQVMAAPVEPAEPIEQSTPMPMAVIIAALASAMLVARRKDDSA